MFKAVLLLFSFIFSSSWSSLTIAHGGSFYWKDSYGRGVGTIPGLRCEEGTQNIASLCYKKCRNGYDNHGVTCNAHTYGRGAGSVVPSWYKNERKRVRTHQYKDRNGVLHWRHGWKNVPTFVTECKPGTVNYGGLCYTPCRAGYKGSYGNCISNVQPPSYGNGVGKALKEYCEGGKVNDAGLCYDKCRHGTTGSGPVCWGNPPSGYENCGAGFAKNKSTCGIISAGQSMSVVSLGLAVCEVTPGAAVCTLLDKGLSFAKTAVSDGLKYLFDGSKEVEGVGEVIEVIDDEMGWMMDEVKPIFIGLEKDPEEVVSAASKLAEIADKVNTKKLIKTILSVKSIASDTVQGVELAKLTGKDQEYAAIRLSANLLATSMLVGGLSNPALDNAASDVTQAILGIISSYLYPIY